MRYLCDRVDEIATSEVDLFRSEVFTQRDRTIIYRFYLVSISFLVFFSSLGSRRHGRVELLKKRFFSYTVSSTAYPATSHLKADHLPGTYSPPIAFYKISAELASLHYHRSAINAAPQPNPWGWTTTTILLAGRNVVHVPKPWRWTWRLR